MNYSLGEVGELCTNIRFRMETIAGRREVQGGL